MWRHGPESSEFEEALDDPRRRSEPAYNSRGKRRWVMPGATESGGILFVVFAKKGRGIRVVTARPATDRERRRYQRGGG
ncbi:MAG: BrnT family toxin [Candidatus Dormibacteria bacterium]